MVHTISSLCEFQEKISSSCLVVVDFFATWCGPCRAIAPKFTELSEKYPAAVFLKVDVDQNSDIASQQNVTAMPTFVLFKCGCRIAEIIGASPDKLEKAIVANL
ncbi:hypothetical protein PORY_002576 [Pneumocystis oryctolagi]|uniref:Uncharacterized protein n=1 Tax=Pneumocystis oryctolagi TaxID=42067 RepID=A0ACB7CAU7_9ASCO|nr:hypothetical protein PORY_002576 [Pneumocystis oryctolagi]